MSQTADSESPSTADGVEMVLADTAAADQRDAKRAIVHDMLASYSSADDGDAVAAASRTPCRTLCTFRLRNRAAARRTGTSTRCVAPGRRPSARNGSTSFVTTAPGADEGVLAERHAADDRRVGADRRAPLHERARYSFLRDTWLRGLRTFVNTIDGPQNTSSSSSTPS